MFIYYVTFIDKFSQLLCYHYLQCVNCVVHDLLLSRKTLNKVG